MNGDSPERGATLSKDTNTCKGASEASPGGAPTPERPEAAGIASGRKRQARKVMPLIGPLLDAWEGLPNDIALLPELKQVRRYIQRINAAMEDA